MQCNNLIHKHENNEIRSNCRPISVLERANASRLIDGSPLKYFWIFHFITDFVVHSKISRPKRILNIQKTTLSLRVALKKYYYKISCVLSIYASIANIPYIYVNNFLTWCNSISSIVFFSFFSYKIHTITGTTCLYYNFTFPMLQNIQTSKYYVKWKPYNGYCMCAFVCMVTLIKYHMNMIYTHSTHLFDEHTQPCTLIYAYFVPLNKTCYTSKQREKRRQTQR